MDDNEISFCLNFNSKALTFIKHSLDEAIARHQQPLTCIASAIIMEHLTDAGLNIESVNTKVFVKHPTRYIFLFNERFMIKTRHGPLRKVRLEISESYGAAFTGQTIRALMIGYYVDTNGYTTDFHFNSSLDKPSYMPWEAFASTVTSMFVDNILNGKL